jgi:hypothetical protein
MWFDDLYHGAEALVSDGIFEADEAKILEQFRAAFRLAYPRKQPRSELVAIHFEL